MSRLEIAKGHDPKQYAGVGLIEWMLVLLLSSCVVMLLLHQMIVTKKQEMMTTDVLAKAYDLNMISELMKNSIRQAGYTPCAVIEKLDHRDHVHADERLRAFTLNPEGHDALTVNSMTQPIARVEALVSQSEIRIQGRHHFSPDDLVMIADCFHAEVVRLKTVKFAWGESFLTLNTALSFSYTNPFYVGIWESQHFFMKKNAEGLRRLYFQQKHAEVLSEWIDGMTVSQVMLKKARLIQIIFQLPDAERWTMQVRVRA